MYCIDASVNASSSDLTLVEDSLTGNFNHPKPIEFSPQKYRHWSSDSRSEGFGSDCDDRSIQESTRHDETSSHDSLSQEQSDLSSEDHSTEGSENDLSDDPSQSRYQYSTSPSERLI